MVSIALAWLGASMDSKAVSSITSQPNIVFILADDLGYGDLSWQNPSSKIRTPRLDSLASQGMCFSSAHAPSSLCTPSRYSIMCGQFCWRSRLKSGVLNAWDEPLIPFGRLTVASLLRDQGYTTGCFGKWHLGFSWPFVGAIPVGFDTTVKAWDINWKRRIGGGPVDHGFDYFFGINIPNEAPYAYILNDHVVGRPSTQYDTASGLQSHWAGPGVADWDWSQVLPTVVSNAAAWIDLCASPPAQRPFFLYLALPGPHQPVVPTAQFQGTSQAGIYGDYVQELDWAVGQVLDKLATSGVAGNTLVIFTSDNGPDEFTYARLQQYGHCSMGPWRGIKNDLWEGGHRVPFLARWPGKIAAGSVSSQLICHVDLMRTIADLLGAQLPANAAEDSISFLPALLGLSSATARSSLILESGPGQFGLWSNNWMFIDARTGDGHNPELEPLWFKQSRGYPATNIFPALLYDLAHDPAEVTNLYEPHFTLAAKWRSQLRKERAFQTWRGTLSESWANCTNWSQQLWPGGCDLLYSNSLTGMDFTQTLGANLSINTLGLNDVTQKVTLLPGGPFTLSLANGIDMSFAGADLELGAPLSLAQSQMWTVCTNRTLNADGPISFNSYDLTINGRGNVLLHNTLSGSGRLIIRSSGLVLLGGSNTYSGGTEMSGGGSLVAHNPQALGLGKLDIPNNSSLQIEPGVILTNSVTLAGWGGNFEGIPRGAVTMYHSGYGELNGPVTLLADAGFYAHQAGSVLTFSGSIAGDANLTIMPGTGTVLLAANNLYTGGTLVEGKLKLRHGRGYLPAATKLVLASTARACLDLNGNIQTVALLSGGGASGGNVTLGGGRLVLDQAGYSTFAGSLVGRGELIKTNSGTLDLVGLSTHSGVTRVHGGALLINGALLNSSVVVSGATLGGTGVITGPVTVQTAGIFSPGPGLGTLSLSNSLTLTGDSTTSMEVDSVRGVASSVQGLSQVTYGGTLVVSNVAAGSFAPGQCFPLFSASHAMGQFSAIFPAPGVGLTWQFSPANGILYVAAQPGIRASRSDAGNLLVSWSGSDFRLQAQRNSLSAGVTNWFDYPGAATSPVIVPIDPSQPALFLRLIRK